MEINVWDYGGSGPDLLLAHCTGTHGRVWDPLVPRLLERFHVYSVDTRGHGDSDKPPSPEDYRWALSGDDLLAVIDTLKLETPLRAAGHSAGGAHICYAEWRRPGTFGRVVLIDPIVGPAEEFRGPNALAEASRRRKNILPDRASAKERFGSKPPMNTWHPAVLDAYVDHGFRDLPDGTIELKCPGHIEAIVYEGSGASDVYDHVHELGFDVLLLTSEHSNVGRLAEGLNGRFARMRYEVIPEATHFIPQEKPVEISRFILDWCAP